MHARPRTNIKHIIGLADGLFVMLNHDHRIALIAQVLQRRQQPVIVALVQTDRRLVEHIEHPRQARADLAGQPDALAFTARQRAELRLSVRYSSPTLFRNPSRSRISFRIAVAISFFCLRQALGTA